MNRNELNFSILVRVKIHQTPYSCCSEFFKIFRVRTVHSKRTVGTILQYLKTLFSIRSFRSWKLKQSNSKHLLYGGQWIRVRISRLLMGQRYGLSRIEVRFVDIQKNIFEFSNEKYSFSIRQLPLSLFTVIHTFVYTYSIYQSFSRWSKSNLMLDHGLNVLEHSTFESQVHPIRVTVK